MTFLQNATQEALDCIQWKACSTASHKDPQSECRWNRTCVITICNGKLLKAAGTGPDRWPTKFCMAAVQLPRLHSTACLHNHMLML